MPCEPIDVQPRERHRQHYQRKNADDVRRQYPLDREKESRHARQHCREKKTAVHPSSRLELNMPNRTMRPVKIPTRLNAV